MPNPEPPNPAAIERASLLGCHAALMADYRTALNRAAELRPDLGFLGPAGVRRDGAAVFAVTAVCRRRSEPTTVDESTRVETSLLWPIADQVAALVREADALTAGDEAADPDYFPPFSHN